MLKHIDKCEEKFNSPGERFVYVGYFRELLLIIILFTDYSIFMNKCLQHMIIDDKTYAYLKWNFIFEVKPKNILTNVKHRNRGENEVAN